MKYSLKQKEIIELSKEMFSQKGYVETSMRDLALQLNIKAASIYSHFKSKEEILRVICDEIYNEMINNKGIILKMNTSIQDKFLTYIKLHIQSIVNNHCSFQVYYKYWALLDKQQSEKYGLLNYEYFDFVKNLVTEMFPKDKELDCYIPNANTLVIIDVLNNIPKLINPENVNIDEVVEDVQMRLMYGFGKQVS